MSATFSIIRRDKLATMWEVFANVTADASYPNTGTFATTGYPVTAGNVGIGNIIGAVEVGTNAAALGYVIEFDPVAGNLHFLLQTGTAAALTEVGNGTDIHTLVKTIRFTGETG